ncbi:MAG: GIY-YIG nuclease family protein [Aphanizomenon flos-aquae Clear-A1]|nr:GIY-YIG nuclease family protein [Aphanizomenon flos-aquae Clear-A1]
MEEGGGLMLFNPIIYNNDIDLSSNTPDEYFTTTLTQRKELVGNNVVSLIRPFLDKIIQGIQSNNFDYSNFTLAKNVKSGLTNQSGLYLIINKKEKRIYLGSSNDLAQRKGEYNENLSKPTRKTKIPKAIREDFTPGVSNINNFYFMPLILINGLNMSTPEGSTYGKEVAAFFDQYIERPLLNYYLTKSPEIFYNVKTIGPFMQGNTFGGSPNSGSPKKPVSYTIVINKQTVSYAWESVKAAADTFNVDTKLIRTKIKNGKMTYLSSSDYELFAGIKISGKEATTFFNLNNRLQDYNQILLELFPNIANKKK